MVIIASTGDAIGEELADALIARGAAVELHLLPQSADAAFHPIFAEAGQGLQVVVLPRRPTRISPPAYL